MKYTDKAKEHIIKEEALLHWRAEDLEAKETNHKQAEFVSNVYFVDHKRSIFIWDMNK